MLRLTWSHVKLGARLEVWLIRKKKTNTQASLLYFPLPQSLLPLLLPILSFPQTNKFSWMHAVFNYFMLSYIFSFEHTFTPWSQPEQTSSSTVCQCATAHQSLGLRCLAQGSDLIQLAMLPLFFVFPPSSPAAREKDLLPPPSLEHQNPSRPRSKPPSGKTAPRKEPRSATNSNNNTVTPPAAIQQPPVPAPAVSVNQVSFVCFDSRSEWVEHRWTVFLHLKYKHLEYASGRPPHISHTVHVACDDHFILVSGWHDSYKTIQCNKKNYGFNLSKKPEATCSKLKNRKYRRTKIIQGNTLLYLSMRLLFFQINEHNTTMIPCTVCILPLFFFKIRSVISK